MDAEGIKVELEDLAILDIKARSKREVADIIAGEIIKKYGKEIMQEIVKSISKDEIREEVINQIAKDAVECWRNSR